MKKIFLILLFLVLSISSTFAAIEDNSIIDKLNTNNVKELNTDFKLKSFESCANLETVMEKYIKNYWEKNKSKYMWWPVLYKDNMLWTTSVMEDTSKAVISDTTNSTWLWWWAVEDFSKTNTQVEWVDESDIVKTDWNYIYYFNDSDKYVYIVKSGTLEIIKKIKVPNNFYSPVLYIWKDRLTIISSGYSNTDYSKYWYWINRNSKTYAIIFDTIDISNPKLLKLYISDWDLTKSRMIGDYLYLISNNSFNIPYYNFNSIDDINIKSNDIIPKSIELSKTQDVSKQNLEIDWKNLPYNLKAWNIANCNQIEYVLPDEETLSKYDFSPSYNIISIINTQNTEQVVNKKVIAWNNAEIYMSLDNLYLTSNLYTSYDYKCSAWLFCMMPFYSRWENTVVHQINVNKNILKYNSSTIIPWTPLNQYSMDQNLDKFRIITQTNYPELATNLYILNTSNLALYWTLGSIQPWEQFKSSRFIDDKLFLVTFERTDPLFVISMSDSKYPKVLWELKVPWYSTYLHPYDENHLIWIGYDTKENQWWGVVNNWIKVDLYEINYNKKCGDSDLTTEEKDKCNSWEYKWIIVKQKYTKTLWWMWSYSEALENPRMFMWKASNNKLFLPVQLYTNSPDVEYQNIDFFQWLVTLTINKDTWIKEDFRLTHIDTSKLEVERTAECSKYTKDTTEKKCVKLIWGWEYCEAVIYNYVPTYCYENSTIWEYLVSKSWNYYNSFIKRALWIWDNTYTISNDKISISNMGTWNLIKSAEMK